MLISRIGEFLHLYIRGRGQNGYCFPYILFMYFRTQGAKNQALPAGEGLIIYYMV